MTGSSCIGTQGRTILIMPSVSPYFCSSRVELPNAPLLP
jgi:hypothetical protein